MMKKENGFTLIEMIVVLVIVGYLAISTIGMAQTYIGNAKLRGVTEEFRGGLMTAKVEAIKRNSAIDFVSTAKGGWSISVPAAYTTNNTAIPLQSKTIDSTTIALAGVDTANNNAVTTVRFTGSGRPDKDVIYKFTSSSAACSANVTCLNVALTSGGQINVCNPNATGTVYGC